MDQVDCGVPMMEMVQIAAEMVEPEGNLSEDGV